MARLASRGVPGPGLDREPAHPFLQRLWREPAHPFLQRLWRALRSQFETEMNVTLQMAVMLADGSPRDEVGRRLNMTRAQLDDAASRIEQIADQIMRDDDAVPR